jgi:hypothetical protein
VGWALSRPFDSFAALSHSGQALSALASSYGTILSSMERTCLDGVLFCHRVIVAQEREKGRCTFSELHDNQLELEYDYHSCDEMKLFFDN